MGRAAVVVVAASVTLGVAGCDGGGPIDRSVAIQNLVHTIDSGPNWETRTDSRAVAGYLKFQDTDNGNDGGGGCALVNGANGEHLFACYLQASAAHGGAEVYFREGGDGSKITPISGVEYNQLVGSGNSGDAGRAAATTSTSAAAKARRPSSTAAYGGTAPAIQYGPATDQSGCDQTTYTVGRDTSCEFGAAVTTVVHEAYSATGHYPATVTAHSTVTGKTYTLRCKGNWSPELVCTVGTAEVTVQIRKPLAIPSTPSTPTTGSSGNTGNAGSGGCSPTTNSGGCYEPGEFCRDDDHGLSGTAGNGETITCEDNDGWRWEPTS